MDEKESFMRELNWRTNLWEGKRDDAKRRVELKNHDSCLAVIDLAVAENALKRIEAKKKEMWDEDKGKLDVLYPEAAKVVKKGKEPEVEAAEMEALKKRVRKKAKAAFALAAKEEEVVEEECIHTHPKGIFGKK